MSQEVTTVEELRTLDDKQIVRGYLAGLKNDPDYLEGNKGYWHGFMNGLVDGGHTKTPSEAQRKLVRALVESGELRN